MKNIIISAATLTARYLPVRTKKAIYRFPLVAGFLRQQLNRASPQGINPVSIAGGELIGMQMALDLQSEKDYWLGTYEPELQAAIGHFLDPGMIVYDLGANIGYISLLLAKFVGANGFVYAFEALPENLIRLKMNIELNQLTPIIIVIEKAVVDATREVNFLIGPSGGTGKVEGSTGRQNLEYSETISIPGVSLDEFVYDLNYPPPHVIKMDIEGGEILALKGMQRLLSEVQPTILLELHGPESARAAWQILSSAGYTIHHLRSGYPKVSSLRELDWKAYLVAICQKVQ